MCIFNFIRLRSESRFRRIFYILVLGMLGRFAFLELTLFIQFGRDDLHRRIIAVASAEGIFRRCREFIVTSRQGFQQIQNLDEVHFFNFIRLRSESRFRRIFYICDHKFFFNFLRLRRRPLPLRWSPARFPFFFLN